MTDIVERLTGPNSGFAYEPPMGALDLMEEAANEITRLRAENEKLRAVVNSLSDLAHKQIAGNKKLRAALEGSQKRFATLKAAYDRERKKPILLYGSAALQQEVK